MFDQIEEYRVRGFKDAAINGSGIGAYVLVHEGLQRVVKFGQDAAYNVFVKHAIANPTEHFPAFFSHALPVGEFAINTNEPYTVTEMELLLPLNDEETKAVEVWFAALIQTLKAQGDPYLVEDPLHLTAIFLSLRELAMQSGVSLDLLKSANYMARTGESGRRIVITDPFF